jgi:RNA polymerase sigma-70 factor (ECF subfamily)
VYLDVADAEVVRRIATRTGDPREAEAELCRRFAPRIRLYGLRHLRDEDRARDLVQTVLLGVLVAVRAGRVEDPERIDRYVLGTCRNAAIRARETADRTDAMPELLDVAAATVDPVDLGALMHCLGLLDERSRLVVSLSFQQGRPTEEVAARLQTTAGNVRVIRHRSVAALRQCLDQGGHEAL